MIAVTPGCPFRITPDLWTSHNNFYACLLRRRQCFIHRRQIRQTRFCRQAVRETAINHFLISFFINSNLFFNAGWDDPLFSQNSSLFLGGGIMWSDEDLKYSLGLAGSALR